MANALLLDLGNTRLKWGLADGVAVTRVRALNYREDSEQVLGAFSDLVLQHKLTDVVGCNVGSSRIARQLTELASEAGHSIRWLPVEREALGVRCAYPTLENLGIDRWLAVLGAHSSTSAALVADIGTATTIDAVAADGTHLGGMILPGLTLMQQALFSRTSRIEKPATELVDPTTPLEFFADDTDTAVQNGCLLAISAAVREGFATLQSTDANARLVLTGGGAAAILRYMPDCCEHRPALVLEGLARRVAAP